MGLRYRVASRRAVAWPRPPSEACVAWTACYVALLTAGRDARPWLYLISEQSYSLDTMATAWGAQGCRLACADRTAHFGTIAPRHYSLWHYSLLTMALLATGRDARPWLYLLQAEMLERTPEIETPAYAVLASHEAEGWEVRSQRVHDRARHALAMPCACHARAICVPCTRTCYE